MRAAVTVRRPAVLLAVALAAGAAVVAGPAAGARPPLDEARLGPDGLGPVKIGMTTAQARAATSSRLRITQTSGSCAVLEQVGEYDGVHFILTDGVVRRATVGSTTSINFYNLTTRGVRLASSEEEVRSRYGRPFAAIRNVDAGGVDLVYRPRPKAQPTRRYVFTVGRLARIPGRYVSEMSVGELPEVRYPEACS